MNNECAIVFYQRIENSGRTNQIRGYSIEHGWVSTKNYYWVPRLDQFISIKIFFPTPPYCGSGDGNVEVDV